MTTLKPYKELEALYNKAQGDKKYYSLDSFLKDAKDFLIDCKNRTTACHITPSRSGMSRRFNFDKYNMLLNIVYNGLASWDEVKVSGCGMDMHWHLKFSTCEALATKKYLEQNNINLACSHGVIL